ncbi:MAG: hypothetical protein RSG59_07525 [Ruthenibacterium sp.]
MKELLYLAAGLRMLLLIAIPTTLAACLCAAAGTAGKRRCERAAQKKHRKE